VLDNPAGGPGSGKETDVFLHEVGYVCNTAARTVEIRQNVDFI
jgi:hypothetical protein